MDQQLITRIVEAALLAANQPLTLAQLNALFPEDEAAPPGSVGQALESLQADCAERGVELVELASGFRFQVRSEVHPWVARLWTERQTRYTRATLETLALIAYRQPITRGEIEQVRGVAVSSNTIRAMEEREWIRVVGHRDVPGKPALFGTTKTFLDYFGLKRLDELPPLSELKELGELEPQFEFDGKRDAVPATIDAGGIRSRDDEGGAGDPETRSLDISGGEVLIDASGASNDDMLEEGMSDAEAPETRTSDGSMPLDDVIRDDVIRDDMAQEEPIDEYPSEHESQHPVPADAAENETEARTVEETPIAREEHTTDSDDAETASSEQQK